MFQNLCYMIENITKIEVQLLEYTKYIKVFFY